MPYIQYATAVIFSWTSSINLAKVALQHFQDDEMTPEQIEAVSDAAFNDLILVTDPARIQIGPLDLSRTRHQLLLVERVVLNENPACKNIFVRPVHSFRPHDWVMYRRYGDNYWYHRNRQLPTYTLESMLDDASIIDLKPSNVFILRKLLHRSCAYDACQDGLVPVNPSNALILGAFRDPILAPGISRGNTICPFCMGIETYGAHEDYVASYVNSPDQFDVDDYGSHMAQVNRRRYELRYGVIAQTAVPTHVEHPSTSDSDIASEGSMASDQTARTRPSAEVIHYLSRNLQVSPPLPTESTVITEASVQPISIKPYSFYQKASERILNNECQVCQDPFKNGDHIAELPCWHFFHEECFKKCTKQECPLRCSQSRD